MCEERIVTIVDYIHRDLFLARPQLPENTLSSMQHSFTSVTSDVPLMSQKFRQYRGQN